MLNRRTQKGLSLIELMVGIVVGMIVVAGAIAFYINTVRSSTYNLRATKLNQELRAVMDLMVSDIRRAGYWGLAINAGNVATVPNPFSVRSGTQTDINLTTGAAGCILFAYDRDADGAVSASEIFGFRRNNNDVQLFSGATSLVGTDTCLTATNWETITDSNTVLVDELRFSTEGSQCLNLSRNESWKLDATAGTGTNGILAGTNVVACEATVGTGVSWNPRFNGTVWANPTVWTAPSTGNKMVETRQIRISLRGHHRDDPSSAITLVENVQVQNDRVFTWP